MCDMAYRCMMKGRPWRRGDRMGVTVNAYLYTQTQRRRWRWRVYLHKLLKAVGVEEKTEEEQHKICKGWGGVRRRRSIEIPGYWHTPKSRSIFFWQNKNNTRSVIALLLSFGFVSTQQLFNFKWPWPLQLTGAHSAMLAANMVHDSFCN